MESTCFEKSAGQLGCALCHDPHEKPSAAVRASFYRQRCQNCHTEKSCSVSLDERRQKNQDACASCHMAKSSAVDVVHVSITDHRILRAPGRERHGGLNRRKRASRHWCRSMRTRDMFRATKRRAIFRSLSCNWPVERRAGAATRLPRTAHRAAIGNYTKLEHDPPAGLTLVRHCGCRASIRTSRGARLGVGARAAL